MTKSVVIELQDLASNGNNEIGDLLRKALMVATKLGLTEFRQWVLAELNGYTDEFSISLPKYRIVRGELKAHNPMRGLIPLQVDPEFHEMLTQVYVTESVSSLAELLSNCGSGTLVYYFGREQEQRLMDAQEYGFQFRPTRTIGANRIAAILGAVRTTILEWSLALEADGILGEGLLFSISEKQAAMNNINIQNFQGILGNVDGGSSVNQTNSQQITAADFSSLARYLTHSGVSTDEVQELKQAVDHDPKPKSPEKFGPKVSAWVGKMLGKAAAGSWEVSVTTAGGFLANALSKYYGIG